jgi:hypothetical protein
MVAEKVEICVSGSPGKLRGQQCHHADCACLAIDRHIGTIHVAPDLDHAEGAASFHTTRWTIVLRLAQNQAQG